jgi:hypothetical protein
MAVLQQMDDGCGLGVGEIKVHEWHLGLLTN